jgi:hypothetical protein
MDLSLFRAANANAPEFCHFRGPDGAKLFAADKSDPEKKAAVGVWLLGQDSDALTRLANQQTDRFLKQREAGAGVTSAAAMDNEIEFLTKATILSEKPWAGIVFGGEEWPFEEERVSQLYREVPLFREQAARFVRDRGNWLKGSPKS